MPEFDVTLKANLKRGAFYWTCRINAETEDEALVKAEHLFDAEMEAAGHWQFDEFQVETAR